MDQREIIRRQHCQKEMRQLLAKLQIAVRDGLSFTRGDQSYLRKFNRNYYFYEMINCLGHVFNLSNQQIKDYHFKPNQMFGYFPGLIYNTDDRAAQRLLDFILETGLRVQDCAPDKLITDPKSRKIALYLETDNIWQKDFHFMLEDAPQIWSGKIGFEPCLERLYADKPPETYHNPIREDSNTYRLYGTYQITNPNADSNNHRLKRCLIQRDGILKPSQPFLIEDGRPKNAIETLFENSNLK